MHQGTDPHCIQYWRREARSFIKIRVYYDVIRKVKGFWRNWVVNYCLSKPKVQSKFAMYKTSIQCNCIPYTYLPFIGQNRLSVTYHLSFIFVQVQVSFTLGTRNRKKNTSTQTNQQISFNFGWRTYGLALHVYF